MYGMDSLLPANATKLEQNIETNIDTRLSALPVNLKHNKNPDLIDTALLDLLAQDLSVDYWIDNWNEDKKRAVIKASIEVHRYKGTAYAVKKSLEAVNAEIEVLEWFNLSAAEPNTVTIVILAREGLSADIVKDVRAIIDKTKPLHVSYGVILKAKGMQTLTLVSALVFQNKLVIHAKVRA